jgi:plasmid stabilization system protein ParE
VEDHPFEIDWSEPAKRDFEKIISSIAENAPLRASRFGERLLRAVESLSQSPYRCPLLTEFPICRYLLLKKYCIVFKIEEREQKVHVVAILFPYEQFNLLRHIQN